MTLAAGCTSGSSSSSSPSTPGIGKVERVVDGDTLVVRIDGRNERVRLIGIDTPESVQPNAPVECFGPEASQYIAGLLPKGTEVRLERDVEARDDFDRLLAYVFRRRDDLFVNDALAREGYADVLTIRPNVAYRDRLAASVRAAREARLGRWNQCRPAPASGR